MDALEFVQLKKIGDKFTANYKGISKTKNNFWLVFTKNKRDYALSISENLKHILRNINKEKKLVLDTEMQVKLIEIVELDKEKVYKKYKITLGNGIDYLDENFNYLEQKDITEYLND